MALIPFYGEAIFPLWIAFAYLPKISWAWANINLQAPWELPGYNLKRTPIYRGQEETNQRVRPPRWVDGRFNKQGNLYNLFGLGCHKRIDLHTHLPNLESLCRALNWIQSHTPSWYSIPHHYLLGAASGNRERKQNICSKDRGGGRVLLITGIQFTGQLVITCPQGSPTAPLPPMAKFIQNPENHQWGPLMQPITKAEQRWEEGKWI